MRPTPNPTAKGKIMNNGNWMKETKITPTNEVNKWPKKIFFQQNSPMSQKSKMDVEKIKNTQLKKWIISIKSP